MKPIGEREESAERPLVAPSTGGGVGAGCAKAGVPRAKKIAEAESLFRQAVDAEKNKASLLERKFQEAIKRAKDTPDTGKPLRDFDLD